MKKNYWYYLSLFCTFCAFFMSLFLIYQNNGFSVFGYVVIILLYLMSVLEGNYFRNLIYKLETIIEIQSNRLRGEENESEQSKD